jgi:two-component system response regulator RegX3
MYGALVPDAGVTPIMETDLAREWSANQRVLLVEAPGPRRDKLAEALRHVGFLTEAVGTGEIALELVHAWHPRLILLDASLLANFDLEVRRKICEVAEGITICFEPNREQLLGMDEAIQTSNETRSQGEMCSLIGHVGMAGAKGAVNSIRGEIQEVGPLTIEESKRVVFVRGQRTHLRKIEYDILLALVSPPGQIRTRRELLNVVWRDHQPQNSKNLDVHMGRLRQKIELDRRTPSLIITVRGVGFFFDADAPDSP